MSQCPYLLAPPVATPVSSSTVMLAPLVSLPNEAELPTAHGLFLSEVSP